MLHTLRRWLSVRRYSGFADAKVIQHMQRLDGGHSPAEQSAILDDLFDLYKCDAVSASEVRRAMLVILQRQPEQITRPGVGRFLVDEVETVDLESLEWDNAASLLNFYATLYAYADDAPDVTSQVRQRAQDVLRLALLKYEETGDHSRLLTLLRMAPAPPGLDQSELLHLRHLAHLRESQRVMRNRRILYTYLMTQLLLILVVFPLLFRNAENGAIQRQIEEASGIELGDPGYRLFSYPTALYWTIITATSIGYGDITPLTNTGRLIAATLGTMSVVTIGIVAGLILRWITPRDLP